VLVVDNGSSPDEARVLESHAKAECPFPIELVRLDRNHGAAGGRNLAFSATKTDWVLSLDNDIYLAGNPLPQIDRDIGTLGYHFLNVPLLNPGGATFHSFGGQLEPTVERGRTVLRFQCALPRGAALAEADKIAPEERVFACSFLFGGASVINRRAFAAAGGFDAEMFVGFEDLEFSLRLVRGGHRIGSSRTVCFVHDHATATTDADREYENVRFSPELIRNSAQHFEAKHGLVIWDRRVENWIADRRRHHGLPPG
jgi:GT2 family glycosyltransferase